MRLLSQISSFLLTAALAAACSSPAPAPQAEATPASTVSVDRGKYIVSTAGCHDCHTPMKMGPNGPEPDMTRALSGHPAEEKVEKGPALSGPWIAAVNSTGTAWSGPWGISYTANLTPDRNNGLGIWTEDMFVKAIRTGRHMGVSRPILPPMPWTEFRKATDEDLKSIYAYLRTIKPIANHVPEPLPPPGPVATN